MPIPVETCDYTVWDGYVEWDTCPADAGEFNRGEYVRTDDADRAYEAVLTRAEKAEQERDTLRAALKKADDGITAGQACRSEGEFTRWMREVQENRPHADLLASSGAETSR